MQTLAEWLRDSWWVLVAAGVGSIGLWLVHWGLLADRANGRRRCPKCWYELGSAAVPVRCSECGQEATRERELLRTHRRWGVALAGAVLISIAPWTRRVPDAVTDGPARLVPTWALFMFCGDEQVKQWTEESLFFGPKPSSPFARELVRRGVEEAIPMWQSAMFERRVQRYLVDRGDAEMSGSEDEIVRMLDAAYMPHDRTVSEMGELFDAIGEATGARVEVDWDSMWEGRILRTDAVSVDTRGRTCGEVLDQVIRSKSRGEIGHSWQRDGSVIRCSWRDECARKLRSFDVGTHVRIAESYADPFWRDCFGTRDPKSEGQLRSGAGREIQWQISRAVDDNIWSSRGAFDLHMAMCGDRLLTLAPMRQGNCVQALLENVERPVRSGDDPLRTPGIPAARPGDGVHPLRTRAYDIADFVRWQRVHDAQEYGMARYAEEIGLEVARVLTSNIEPESWMQNGGEEGRIGAFGHFLIVTHADAVHSRVAVLLDAIRAKRPALRGGG